MTEILCRAAFGKLSAIDEQGAEVLRRIGRDEILKVTFTRPRNVKWHRLFFALLNLLFENQQTYTDFDHFRSAFEIAMGHCDTFKLKSGETAYIAKSISFAKLDQSGFETMWNKAVDLACTKIIPHLNRADLEREIRELVEDRV